MKERIFEFYKLYLPSALAIASDFWRVTVIGVIAANRGSVEVFGKVFGEVKHDLGINNEVQVAVFNVGYRFLWICLMFSGAMARASGIRSKESRFKSNGRNKSALVGFDV